MFGDALAAVAAVTILYVAYYFLAGRLPVKRATKRVSGWGLGTRSRTALSGLAGIGTDLPS
jgi:hypothetical protein